MERVRNKWKSENQITSQIKKHSGSIGCDWWQIEEWSSKLEDRLGSMRPQ
jgi:hypothetical protein